MITKLIIITALVIITSIVIVFVVIKSPKTRVPFQIFLGAIILILSYFLINSIYTPIKFNRELKTRSEATVDKLKDIRTIQVAYKDRYGTYTGSFDTLIKFVATDSFEITGLVQHGEWNQDEMTKKEALQEGILEEVKSYSPVKDSLWKEKTYDIGNLRFVPYTKQVEFELGSGELETASKVKVNVFESYVLYTTLLKGLDKQLIINLIDEKTKYGGFEGIKVGSLTEATNNAGNWED